MKRGRGSRNSTMIDGRQYAVAISGTVITYECKRAGHRYKIDHGKRPLAQRLSPAACAMLARWWSKERGGCIGACPTCVRHEKKARALSERGSTGVIPSKKDTTP